MHPSAEYKVNIICHLAWQDVSYPIPTLSVCPVISTSPLLFELTGNNVQLQESKVKIRKEEQMLRQLTFKRKTGENMLPATQSILCLILLIYEATMHCLNYNRQESI